MGTTSFGGRSMFLHSTIIFVLRCLRQLRNSLRVRGEMSLSSVTSTHFDTDILTFIILYNNLIPISLIVTMEVVKFQQAQLINTDLDMYYAKTDTPALCRTSSLVEELGQIEYVFSDKTGTLTRNEMEFQCCSIAGVAYAAEVDEARREEGEGREAWRTFDEMRAVLETDNPFVDSSYPKVVGTPKEREIIREFLTLLAVCHTVIPEIKNEKMVYQASSPDEAALVAGAERLGFRFTVRTSQPQSTLLHLTSCLIAHRCGSRSQFSLISWASPKSFRF
jgi:phospholipid-transporting ATPase